jgi:hypothetical protein
MSHIYEKLVAIAAQQSSLGYLAHYQDDLHVHDKRTLDGAKHGQRYLWVLRTCGTALFEIESGHDSVWATYWLDQGNIRDTPSLVYLITIASDGADSGVISKISYDYARTLASLPHPEGKVIKFSLS